MKHNTISDCCHGKLTNTKVQVSACAVRTGKITLAFHVGLGRGRQIGRATNQVRQNVFQAVDHHTGKISGRLRLVLKLPVTVIVIGVDGLQRIMVRLPFCFQLWELILVRLHHFVPACFFCRAVHRQRLIVRIDFFRDKERLHARPIKALLHLLNVLFTQRFAMRGGCALLCRASLTNLRFHNDERGTLFVGLCLLNSLTNGIHIIAVLHRQYLETERLHPLAHIFGKGNISAAFNGNAIGVV